MAAALVEVCVDPRLNHELIRLQVRQRLERSGISADRILILNDIGGNPGRNLHNTVELLEKNAEPVVFSAVLHHDDCLAAQRGMRTDLATAAQHMGEELARSNIHVPVVTGNVRTENNQLLWSDEPEWRYAPFTFGPGTPEPHVRTEAPPPPVATASSPVREPQPSPAPAASRPSQLAPVAPVKERQSLTKGSQLGGLAFVLLVLVALGVVFGAGQSACTWLFQRVGGRPAASASASALASAVAPQATPTASQRVVLFADDYSSPTSGKLPHSSSDSGHFDQGYDAGEYFIRKIDPEWRQVAVAYLPGNYSDTTLEVDARITGETAGRTLYLSCRRQSGPESSGYRLFLRPDTGLASLTRWEHSRVTQTLAQLRPYSAIRRENATNHLALACSGSSITAAVNGATIARAQDSTFSEGQLWIGISDIDVQGVSEARFKNLQVFQS